MVLYESPANHFEGESVNNINLFHLHTHFNISGESGLGKSTLINSLFLTDIYCGSPYEDAASKFGKTMTVSVPYWLLISDWLPGWL